MNFDSRPRTRTAYSGIGIFAVTPVSASDIFSPERKASRGGTPGLTNSTYEIRDTRTVIFHRQNRRSRRNGINIMPVTSLYSG